MAYPTDRDAEGLSAPIVPAQDLARGKAAIVDPITRLVELAVFLFLILPSLILSLFVIGQGGASFTLTALSIILRDLALVSLILFFLWRNAEPVRLLGWTGRHLGREIALGLLMYLPFLVVVGWVDTFFRSLGLSTPSTPQPAFLDAQGIGQMILALVLVTVVAVAEETIFRGYLILRLSEATKSVAAAALLSSLIFAIGHGYEGTAGVATVGVMGLAFAVIYLWRGSLVAPMVMHFLQDFLGVVLLPLLGSK